MFWRVLARLLQGNRGRLVVALVALVSGAAVISAMLNVEFDAERKLTQEFRALGANLVVEAETSSASPDAPQLMEESLLARIEARATPDVTFAPYLYVVGRVTSGMPVVVAGTWLDRMARMAPWWKLEGEAIGSREDEVRCLVGRTAARSLHLTPDRELTLRAGGREVRLKVAAIIESGGTEDSQVIVNLPVAQRLGGLAGKIQFVEIGIAGNAARIEEWRKGLAAALTGVDVRPIRQIADAEAQLLSRIQLLIFSMVVLILVLTALCVLATMAALAMERREDVGLMKSIGGSINRVMAFFLAEIGFVSAVGGLAGYLLGMLLTGWIGQRVFGTAISPRLEVLPLTVALMVGVALTGALPLRLLGRVKPAVILRGER